MPSPVSQATAARLRQAMARLLAGEPERTDGALTLANLGREAGLSHATVHRATAITSEFSEAVKAKQVDALLAKEEKRAARVGDLQRLLKQRNAEKAELTQRCDLMAQNIQYLHLQNKSLLYELDVLRKRFDSAP